MLVFTKEPIKMYSELTAQLSRTYIEVIRKHKTLQTAQYGGDAFSGRTKDAHRAWDRRCIGGLVDARPVLGMAAAVASIENFSIRGPGWS